MNLITTIESDEEIEEEVEEVIAEEPAISLPVANIPQNVKSQNEGKLDSFNQLALSRPLMKALKTLGFAVPTPIQERSIPEALKGRDICGSAVTGSGKTAAYLLPTLERLIYRSKSNPAIRALVLTPTRELAAQVSTMCASLCQFTDIEVETVVGGVDLTQQSHRLRTKPDVVVATPGRLIDHVRNTMGVDLDAIEILVLDESDRLLEMGFQEEVLEIIRFCPIKRQTLLFTATMTSSVSQLVDLSLNKPIRISVDNLFESSNRLRQEFVKVKEYKDEDHSEREAVLLSLCSRVYKKKAIVFFKRKFRCHRVSLLFQLAGLNCAELHGNLSQKQRLENLRRFRDKEVDFLLCTDVASRGLDIKNVETVINFEMPKDITTYVHRVGRTARAGRGGVSVTITTTKGDQKKQLKQIMKKSKTEVKLRRLDEESLDQLKAFVKESDPKLEDMIEQEKVDRSIQKAESEMQKVDNIIQHEREIFSRPARTWFQSSKEKQLMKMKMAEKDADLDRNGDGDKSIADKVKKKEVLTRKKRKRMESMKWEEQQYKERSAQRQMGQEVNAPSAAFSIAKEQKLVRKKARKEKLAKQKHYDEMTISEQFSGKVKFSQHTPTLRDKNLIDRRSKPSAVKQFKEHNILASGGLRKGGKLSSSKFKSRKKYKRR